MTNGQYVRAVLHAIEQFDDGGDVVAATGGHLCQGYGLLRHTVDVVERDRLGDVLDDIQDIVHATDELMNFVTVKGGDK